MDHVQRGSTLAIGHQSLKRCVAPCRAALEDYKCWKHIDEGRKTEDEVFDFRPSSELLAKLWLQQPVIPVGAAIEDV